MDPSTRVQHTRVSTRYQTDLTDAPLVALAAILVTLLWSATAYAHGVAEGDQGYVQEVSGAQFGPFMYLGAKHMVTGY